MRVGNVLSAAAVAVSLCTDYAAASSPHGRFGQRARDSVNLAKRASHLHNATASGKLPKSDFRFLTDQTSRTYKDSSNK
jgi:carboxypeptidase D